MKKSILIISDQSDIFNYCKEILLPLSYTVIGTRPMDLMTSIYTEQPTGIIIYYDSLSFDAIETINSVLSVVYVPVLAVYEEQGFSSQAHQIKYATPLYKDHIATALPLLVSQMSTFNIKYNNLSDGYDSFILMNDESQKVFNRYLRAKPRFENEILREFYKHIFTDSPFVNNEPSIILLLEKLETLASSNTLLTLFINNAEDYIHMEPRIISLDIQNYLDKTKDTGFYVNFGAKELSDIDDLKTIIPQEVLKDSTPKDNIAVTSVNDMLMICYDFDHDVDQNLLSLLKGFNGLLTFMKSIKQKINDVHQAFVYTTDALARAAESKDDVTGHHIKRVNAFSKALAKQMNLNVDFIDEIAIAAQMHDVGKIKVPENILNKPGRLTDEEFDIMKKHPIYGEEIIGHSAHLSMAKQIARGHHEKYDGSGYPDGLIGDEIPLEARIVSLADIYDALRSPRSYKEGFSHKMAYDIIVNGDGRVEPSHFDPKVLKSFIEIHETFNAIYERNKDIDF